MNYRSFYASLNPQSFADDGLDILFNVYESERYKWARCDRGLRVSQWKAITVKSRYPNKLLLFSLKIIDTNVNVFPSFFSPILWSLK